VIVYLNPDFDHEGYNSTLLVKKTKDALIFTKVGRDGYTATYRYNHPYNAYMNKNSKIRQIDSDEGIGLWFTRGELLSEKEFHDKGFQVNLDELLK